jgi:hypothetical protein
MLLLEAHIKQFVHISFFFEVCNKVNGEASILIVGSFI